MKYVHLTSNFEFYHTFAYKNYMKYVYNWIKSTLRFFLETQYNYNNIIYNFHTNMSNIIKITYKIQNTISPFRLPYIFDTLLNLISKLVNMTWVFMDRLLVKIKTKST